MSEQIDPYDLIREDLFKIQKYRGLLERKWLAEITQNQTDLDAVNLELPEVETVAKEAAARFANIPEGGFMESGA